MEWAYAMLRRANAWLRGEPFEKRVALVIGNGAYNTAATLASPVQDAAIMMAALEKCSFGVSIGLDLPAAGMQQTFDAFVASLDGADVALLYYSGHGVQVGGENYLVPTDGALRDADDLRQFPSLPDLMARMSKKAKKCIVIFDACRNEPVSRSFGDAIARSKSMVQAATEKRALNVASDLAQDRATMWGADNYIAFATAPGSVAYAGDGLSPFTEGIAGHITTRGLEINDLMMRASLYVESLKDAAAQTVWANSSFRSRFFFRGRSYRPAVIFTGLGIVASLLAAATKTMTSSDYGALAFATLLGLATWFAARQRSRFSSGANPFYPMIAIFALLSLVIVVHTKPMISDPLVEHFFEKDYQLLYDRINESRTKISEIEKQISTLELAGAKVNYFAKGKDAANPEAFQQINPNDKALFDLNASLQEAKAEEQRRVDAKDKSLQGSLWNAILTIATLSVLIWASAALCFDLFSSPRAWTNAFVLCLAGVAYSIASGILVTYIARIVAFAGVGLAIAYELSQKPSPGLDFRATDWAEFPWRKMLSRRLAVFGAIGALCGVMSAFAVTWPDGAPSFYKRMFTVIGVNKDASEWPPLVLFIGLSCIVAFFYVDKKIILSLLVATPVGWHIAYGLGINLAVSAGDDIQISILSSALCGFVGAAMVGLAIFAFYSTIDVLILVFFTAMVGALLAMPWAMLKDPAANPYLLFIPWQAGVAAAIGAILTYLDAKAAVPKPAPVSALPWVGARAQD
ncbi:MULTISPECIES: caspase family protein [Rhodomicrobium]|uniref:caspase family protein n=1 Tax=Rhodomicrobium TaxID=1068 RepID=UPI000B4A6702|nr:MULTISPECIES: caspase family protein [Rhodomicrobium]